MQHSARCTIKLVAGLQALPVHEGQRLPLHRTEFRLRLPARAHGERSLSHGEGEGALGEPESIAPGSESDEEDVTRCFAATPLVVYHTMATSLDGVGCQVLPCLARRFCLAWMFLFLMGARTEGSGQKQRLSLSP